MQIRISWTTIIKPPCKWRKKKNISMWLRYLKGLELLKSDHLAGWKGRSRVRGLKTKLNENVNTNVNAKRRGWMMEDGGRRTEDGGRRTRNEGGRVKGKEVGGGR